MIREKLTSDKVIVRIGTLFLIFLVVFLAVTVASHYLLPEGFLKSHNTSRDFQMTGNMWTVALEIFLLNLMK